MLLACIWVPWLGLVAGGYALFWIPQSQQAKSLQTKLAQSKDQAELARLASLKGSRSRQAEQLKTLTGKVEQFTVSADSQDQLIFKISNIANELKLHDYTGKISRNNKVSKDISKLKNLKRVSLDIQFTATFQQFAQFINILERHDPVVLVESASMNRAYDSSKLHRAQLLLSFIVLNPDQESKQTAGTIQIENRNSQSRKVEQL